MITVPCRSCHRPMRWTVTANGKRMPVDPDPVPGGNLELTDVVGVTHSTVVVPDPLMRRHVSHFTTCPDRDKHRRK